MGKTQTFSKSDLIDQVAAKTGFAKTNVKELIDAALAEITAQTEAGSKVILALKDVSRGLITLPVATGETPAAVSGGTVMAAHPEPVFTPARLAGWR